MMNPNDVIIRPVVSEKSSGLMEKNKYVFRVPMQVNKLQVEKAIQELFGVKPEKVNVLIVRGKKRRVRYKIGKRTAWKKAVVTLKPGEKIQIFESTAK